MDQASSPRRLAFPGDIMDVNLFPSIPGDFRCMRGNLKSTVATRIGISQAAHYPWRFLLKGTVASVFLLDVSFSDRSS